MVISRKQYMYGMLGVAALSMLMVVGDASAATSIANKTTEWKTQVNAILGFAKIMFAAVGVFIFAGGLFYIYKENKEPDRGHLKTGIVAMLVAAGLMIIPYLIGMITESIASGQGNEAQQRSTGSNV